LTFGAIELHNAIFSSGLCHCEPTAHDAPAAPMPPPEAPGLPRGSGAWRWRCTVFTVIYGHSKRDEASLLEFRGDALMAPDLSQLERIAAV
jgi:hypothetical protein